ncbi:hypothetical protein [Streptomyces sp. NPDC057253]|uniref:hypothetical protein n=1 Tax=Streptomyces sp. NPDC057253 TaxID=3346069 RepID=UPI00364243E9
MAAPAPLLLPALSKPEAPADHFCVFSAEGACTETPLTSEPPLPDAEQPLTSEPPLADAAPLTSESDAYPEPCPSGESYAHLEP